jgi:CheY-like chemotaxis protein
MNDEDGRIPSAGARRVLVIEDEPMIALGLRLVLEGMGLEVPEIVDNGAQAVASADRIAFDLVLADVRLKGGDDGIAAVQEILRRHDMPVLFVTGNAAEVVERGMSHIPVLNKPFLPSALERTVRAMLGLD